MVEGPNFFLVARRPHRKKMRQIIFIIGMTVFFHYLLLTDWLQITDITKISDRIIIYERSGIPNFYFLSKDYTKSEYIE